MDTAGVVSNPETQDKIGRLDPNVLPKVSFLDPTNTFTVSPYQTACGSADIMSHIIEVYFNMNQDLYMLDCFMEGMMKTVIKYAPIAMKEPDNYEARANLMWASSWAMNGFMSSGFGGGGRGAHCGYLPAGIRHGRQGRPRYRGPAACGALRQDLLYGLPARCEARHG